MTVQFMTQKQTTIRFSYEYSGILVYILSLSYSDTTTKCSYRYPLIGLSGFALHIIHKGFLYKKTDVCEAQRENLSILHN